MIESKFLSLIYIYIYVYITRNTDTKKMRKTIPENILLFSKRVEHDFDFCDSHLIPKESKANFFQNNRVPFYVSLKIPFKSEKKKKKLKAIFLSLFKKIIAYLRFSFFFFFFPFYSTCTKHEYQKKKTSKKTAEDRCYRFQKPFYPRTEVGKILTPSPYVVTIYGCVNWALKLGIVIHKDFNIVHEKRRAREYLNPKTETSSVTRIRVKWRGGPRPL